MNEPTCEVDGCTENAVTMRKQVYRCAKHFKIYQKEYMREWRKNYKAGDSGLFRKWDGTEFGDRKR
jgi:hypothetical protein